jgi:hypothetical protein
MTDAAKIKEALEKAQSLQRQTCPLCKLEVPEVNVYAHLRLCIFLYEDLHKLNKKNPAQAIAVSKPIVLSDDETDESDEEVEKDCCLPQSICKSPDKPSKKSICIRYEDLSLPLCKFSHLKSSQAEGGAIFWTEIEKMQEDASKFASDAEIECFHCKRKVNSFIIVSNKKDGEETAIHRLCSFDCLKISLPAFKQVAWEYAVKKNVSLEEANSKRKSEKSDKSEVDQSQTGQKKKKKKKDSKNK